MRLNISNFLFKASSFILLAFCVSKISLGQELKSISGANSPNDDFNPVSVGNQTILFTRAFHPKNLGGKNDPGDIWMIRKDDAGNWGNAIHRPDLSTSGYDLPLGMEDVLTLLILRNENGSVSIHQFSKFGADWNYLRQVNLEGLSTLQGTITGRVASQGKILFLSGKRSDSLGNEDIYFSEKLGPIDWGKLESLGPAINGKGQEVGPFFQSETSLLYFSSNSHPGATGKDILISKKLENGWSSPVKWEQISGRGSESSILVLSSTEAIWSSTQNSDGFADLMTFSKPQDLIVPNEFENYQPIAPESKVEKVKPVSILKKEEKIESPVQEQETVPAPRIEEEIPVSWLVMDSKSKLELPYELEWQKGNDPILLPKESLASELKNLGVTAAKVTSKGYFPVWVSINALMPKGRTVVQLTKAETGSALVLKEVQFQRGTAEFEGKETVTVLEEIARFLMDNPSVKIRINGHTDNVGDPGLNKQLSLERAGKIRDFLTQLGVEFENVRISGWGGTKPIASNATEAGRSKNRRVELVVE